MKHITLGQIERYTQRAIKLFGAGKFFEWAATQPTNMGRRAMLKALRDYMQPMTRKQLERRTRRARKGVYH